MRENIGNLISAIEQMPAPPCESGCGNVDRCKKEKLACIAFARYVETGTQAIEPGERDRPTRGIFSKVMSKDDKVEEEDIIYIRECKKRYDAIRGQIDRLREEIKTDKSTKDANEEKIKALRLRAENLTVDHLMAQLYIKRKHVREIWGMDEVSEDG